MYKSYNDDRGNGGYKKFGGPRGGRGGFGGGFGGGDRQMHDATCAACGGNAQVPFKPYPGKQVFCSNCFKRDEGRDGGDRPSFGGKRPYVSTPRGGGDNSQIEKRLARIEEKLDALIEALTEGLEDEDEDELDGEAEGGNETKE